MASGGDIVEITYNHPTLGPGVISPKVNEDSTYDLGGIRSSDDASMISGNGDVIDQMNRVRWSFEVLCTWEMVDDDTMQRIVDLAASPLPAEWTFANINGVIYQGTGKPVGDYTGNGNQSTFNLKVSGGGVLKKQS